MTALNGGPIRRNQLQDKFGLPASKGSPGTRVHPDPGAVNSVKAMKLA